MSNAETVESYLRRSDLPHEQMDPETWVLQLNNQRKSRVALMIEDPIVLFSTAVLDLTALTANQEALFRLLLELNNTLMHCAYAIQDDRVVLSGAQPLENLDQNEFQAVVDDMAVALDSHQAALAPWSTASAPGTEI